MRSEPMAAALLLRSANCIKEVCVWAVPCSCSVLGQSLHFDLNTIDPIDAVEEEDENEDEGDLPMSREWQPASRIEQRTFMPYCILATIGLSEMKLNIFRLTVKGMGMMRARNNTISATRRTNTYTTQ